MSDRRILLLTPDFPPERGGIGLMMHRLAQHFERLTVHVVTRAAPSANEFDRVQAFAVRRIRVPASHRAEVAALNFRAVMEALRIRPRVVLSGHIVTSPAAAAIARALRIPVVQYVYADEMRARPALTRFALRSAAITIALSRYARGVALTLGPGSTVVETIPPGVDLPDHRVVEQPTRPTVLTVARMQERYKGHDILIRALPLILARVPDARWVAVGDGPLRRPLEHLAEALGVSEHVFFAGSRSFESDAGWFERAHVFAMPSRLGPGGAGGEGFGIVYLEANARGLPVVAGNVAGALDAVVDGVTGLLVDPTDHVAVAESVTTLLLDRARAEVLGRAGAERAREFAWPKVARQVEDVVLSLANGPR
jgi:phosphatidylinositol alpha-1,6-mannosyltransferase